MHQLGRTAILCALALSPARAQQDTARMDMGRPLGIAMERMGSGTTWIPDELTLPSRHYMVGAWGVMLHGFVFQQYDRQAGPRGDAQVGNLNWAMIMVDRPIAGGRLELRFMPSLDPATVGSCGYPLLLQSGETCGGRRLVDRQHPHDFFMELGALFERELSRRVAGFVYAAPAGEPALGPVAFMHRPSAMDNTLAPLGHHWQDATHISFGVATVGLFTNQVRVEASAFNGTEPDENRWNIDPVKLNSYSARVTLNPTRRWSFTGGYGAIAEPEPGNPNHLLHRAVVSAMHGQKIGANGQWGTSLIYGANKEAAWSRSALIESEAVLDARNSVYGRAEWVEKSASDLGLSGFASDTKFGVGSASLGYVRELVRGRGVTIGLGASSAVNFVPKDLESAYGSRTPVGVTAFVRLRPSYVERAHDEMDAMSHHH